MDSTARIPLPMVFDGNLSENYRKFKQAFDNYLIATEKDKKTSKVKVAILLNLIGEEGVEVYNNFTLTNEDKLNYEKVIEEFNKYVLPKKNILYERFKFYNRCQEENEPFDNFLQELKKMVRSCEFGETSNDMIRDRIALGITDKKVQEKLFTDMKNIDLSSVVTLCRSRELGKFQINKIKNLIPEKFQKYQNKRVTV